VNEGCLLLFSSSNLINLDTLRGQIKIVVCCSSGLKVAGVRLSRLYELHLYLSVFCTEILLGSVTRLGIVEHITVEEDDICSYYQHCFPFCIRH
jgi:hypothetical protein